MTIKCEATDFMFPMLADVYHPVIETGTYGSLSKTWLIDRTVAGNFIRAGAEQKEELIVNIDLTQDSLLIARTKSDIRMSSSKEPNALTNILVTNIRNSSGHVYYLETAGKRVGKPTVFEIATLQPFVNPFGATEHYTIILRKSENQGVV
jgi:hypothetical protein